MDTADAGAIFDKYDNHTGAIFKMPTMYRPNFSEIAKKRTYL